MIMSRIEKWGFIVNPIAGNGYAGQHLDDVKRMIDKYAINADLMVTEGVGHATKLAADFIEKGYKYIAPVGGDGTISEAAQAVVGHDDVVFGPVSMGTGNDFIQIVGFSDHFTEKDWEIYFQKNTIRMDVGQCNDHYFLNGMGLGFDAEVAAQNYSEGSLKKGGKDKYLWHILKTLVTYREHPMTVLNNGKSEKFNCFINTISIGRRFAGAYFLTPQAIANDGLLDVCLIKELRFLQRFKIFTMVPTGSHLKHPQVQYLKTDALNLEFDKKVPHHMDGELFFASRYKIKVLPQKLNIIYNPDGKHCFSL